MNRRPHDRRPVGVPPRGCLSGRTWALVPRTVLVFSVQGEDLDEVTAALARMCKLLEGV
ncbi:hypothetical protein ACFH04_41825 [Streptomyces noboritoensis]|uniref:Uncharacterized protein n=1 Tax=Streptomyces noboritoensis TaxID=67337 RepID=A0ABV6TCW2_9ACTN